MYTTKYQILKWLNSATKMTFQVGSSVDLESVDLECGDFPCRVFNRLGKYFLKSIILKTVFKSHFYVFGTVKKSTFQVGYSDNRLESEFYLQTKFVTISQESVGKCHLEDARLLRINREDNKEFQIGSLLPPKKNDSTH